MKASPIKKFDDAIAKARKGTSPMKTRISPGEMKQALRVVPTPVSEDNYQQVSKRLVGDILVNGNVSGGAADLGVDWLQRHAPSDGPTAAFTGTKLSEEGLERAIGENLALIGDIFTATLTPAIDAEELNQSTMRALAKKVSPELFDKFKATTFEALPEQMFIDDGDSHMPSEEDVAQLMTYIKSEVGDDAQLMLASAFLGASGSALIAVKSDGSKALAISMQSSLGSFE